MRERGEIPLFQLEAPDGRKRGTLDAWQRRDMLVALLHPGCDVCQALHRVLDSMAPGWRKEEVELFSIVRPGSAPVPPGALADADGHVTQVLSEALELKPDAAVLAVANRFSKLYAVLDIHSGSTAAVLKEALEWLQLAQLQCGECQAPLAWD